MRVGYLSQKGIISNEGKGKNLAENVLIRNNS